MLYLYREIQSQRLGMQAQYQLPSTVEQGEIETQNSHALLLCVFKS